MTHNPPERARTRSTVRSLQKTNLSLHRLVTALRRKITRQAHNQRRVGAEIERRKTAEDANDKAKAEYKKLFAESLLMQQKLRRLTRQIIATQEEERKEISRELHDEVVQNLVSINVQLAALGKAASIQQLGLKAEILRTQRLVENSVKVVHRFARELRPAALDDLGLIPALQAFTRSVAARRKISIGLTAVGGVEALTSDKRTAFYRVAQEALTNVIRHAHATAVRISIVQIAGGFRLEVSDNGKSFASEQALAGRSASRLGPIGMRERLEMVGGTLEILPAAAGGTTIRAEIPADKRPAN